jgi:hypothetical protein
MGLPKEASSHHMVWVQPWYGGRPRALRYATSGSHLYCFGDDGLAAVADGEQVTASIHRIANGPPVAEFSATVRTVAPEDVDLGLVSELVGHRRPGRTFDETLRRLQEYRDRRRIVELTA